MSDTPNFLPIYDIPEPDIGQSPTQTKNLSRRIVFFLPIYNIPETDLVRVRLTKKLATEVSFFSPKIRYTGTGFWSESDSPENSSTDDVSQEGYKR